MNLLEIDLALKYLNRAPVTGFQEIDEIATVRGALYRDAQAIQEQAQREQQAQQAQQAPVAPTGAPAVPAAAPAPTAAPTGAPAAGGDPA